MKSHERVMKHTTWMTRTLAGEAVDIDEEVQRWHDGVADKVSRTLPDWLGFTPEEFEQFQAAPHRTLPSIVARRMTSQVAHIPACEHAEMGPDGSNAPHRIGKVGLAMIDGEPKIVPQAGEVLKVPTSAGRVHNGTDEVKDT